MEPVKVQSSKISGPVSLYIVCDKTTDRYFYIFGDYHHSLDGNCSQLERGLRADRPSFDYKGVVTTEGNAWTISALIHEVLSANGKKGITTDYYRESSYLTDPHMYLPIQLKEYTYRENKIYTEPRSKEQVEATKARLKESNFGWINDVDLMLYKKNYRNTSTIINADCRVLDNKFIIPCLHPTDEKEFIDKFPSAIQALQRNGNREEYEYKMEQLLFSLEEYITLLEQITGDPYLFLSCFFDSVVYSECMGMLVQYLPGESELLKTLIQKLYKAVDNVVGISPSSTAWSRLNDASPGIAYILQEFIREELTERSAKFEGIVSTVSSALQMGGLASVHNIDILIGIIPQISQLCNLSVQLGALVMDMYVLSETLIRNTKHSIYFAGDYHAKTYYQFLTQYMGFESMEAIPSKDFEDKVVRCVESVEIDRLLNLKGAREALYQ
jgi:hypothetical protein